MSSAPKLPRIAEIRLREPHPGERVGTSRLKDAGQLLGIPLLDHVIAGHDQWTSLRARGHIAS